MRHFAKKVINRIRRDRDEFGYGGGVYRRVYIEFGAPGNYILLKLRWFLMFLFEYGVSVDDFFVYHLYEKSRDERSKFVSLGRSRYIIKLLNKGCKRELVENKAIFGKVFTDYLQRNSISSIGLDYHAFNKFYISEGRIIIKPAFGCNGNGIFIIDEGADELTLKKHFETIQSGPYVLETVLVQDGILRQLNPKTLNTIRINVLNNHGKMKIINAILRSGQGDVVTDNICAGGCVVEIDVNTGKVISKFVDLSNHVYDSHPLSKTMLLGTEIPSWDGVRKMVYEATDKLTGVGYASWDIAVISGNRIAIVEGNTYGNFNIQQVPSQQGVWPEYKTFIKEWKQ